MIIQRRFKQIFIGGLLLAGMAGCGSSSDQLNQVSGLQGGGAGGSTLAIREQIPPPVDGRAVNEIEIEAFDAEGKPLPFTTVSAQQAANAENPVEGVDYLRVSANETMEIPMPPKGTDILEIDYLSNGYALYRANEKLTAGQTVIDNPDEHLAEKSSSKWTLKKAENGDFTLALTKAVVGQQTIDSDFVIKGVCYSPCPINVQGDGAPNIGDFFFDSLVNKSNPSQTDFFNWYGLWGVGSLGDSYYAREDINKIRDLKANTIRTYSMLSRQQNEPPYTVAHPEFPDPSTQTHFTHTQFLDMCWNNGKNPVYVIVGIPTPPDNLYQDLQGNAAKIKFYDFVLRETIADVKDHPAVLGFTLQNEINDGADAFPKAGGGQMTADQPETGVSNSRSDFYWGKVKEHSDYAKSTAPDKLAGICVHDFREIAQYASVFPRNEPSYLEKASNLDFVGINTYQTQNYNDQFTKGWGAINGPARKAVLFSELGFPATTRDGSDPKTIKETSESRSKTAGFVERMLPKAYSNAVSLGACYFEFSDEWWKQKSNTKVVDGKTVIANDEWYGGDPNGDFPNGYWDEEGFGLFSIARYPGLANSDPVMVTINGKAIGPDRRLDRLTERKEITSVIKTIFGGL